MNGPSVGPAPATNGNVVKIHPGWVGPFVGILLFLIQMVAIFMSQARSDADIKAEVRVLKSVGDDLRKEAKEFIATIQILERQQALHMQRLEVLERANPPGRSRRPYP